jgi:patatin-like phospholipase/acyl hydrolase
MNTSTTAPLLGIRIWLSGSFPENASDEDKEHIRHFVKRLASEVFTLGGTLVHGWNPDLLEPLREAAQNYKNATAGNRAPLAMFVSRWFSKEPEKYKIDLAAWNDLCLESVRETPEAFKSPEQGEEQRRAMSLSVMRQEIANASQAIVAIGGKWWTVARARAGVSEEIDLAAASYLPLFLLGGMGGTVEGLLKTNPGLLQNFANGLSREQNEELAAQKDPEKAVRQVVDQLQRLSLRTIARKDDKPFRVLCLDGGGIRGAYTAAVLAYWENALGLHEKGRLRLVDHFDLITGTSTGGILAIGLALGMKAADLQEFYEKRGPNIFGGGEGLNKWWHSIRHWFTSKFNQDALQRELQEAYASSPKGKTGRPQTEWLDDPPCKLLVPAYNTEIDRPHLFRSPYGRFVHTDKGHDPVIVALSTAAAPTYFNPVQSRNSFATIRTIDGGVWANSPVSLAIAEAVAELKIPIERIRLLSIGTTHTTQLQGQPMQLDGKIIGAFLKYVLPRPAGWIAGTLAAKAWRAVPLNGLVGWVSNIAGLLMKTQSQTSNLVGQQLLGERYVRVDSESPFDAMDDVARTNHFVNLGHDAAGQSDCFARVQSLFLNNTPAA